MSSSSKLNPVSRAERQLLEDLAKHESKPDLQQQPLKASTTRTSERKTTSSSQRKITEKTKTTTTKSLASKTRSPGRSTGRASNPGPPSKSGSRHTSEVHPTAEVVQAPQLWNPQVSLVPHTTAPLASRISKAPLASQAPKSLEPRPFHQMNLELQEAAILEDLFSVLMGYEGQYIRFTKHYNASEEKSRATGPNFEIRPGLHPTLRDLTISILKMATHFGAIKAFIEIHSKGEYGLVNHALCAAIRKLLQDYLVMIVQLETQFLTNSEFTLHVLNLHTLSTSHMVSQTYLLTLDISKQNSILEESDDSDKELDDIENVLEALRVGGDFGLGVVSKVVCKGGSVLGIITERLQMMSGDPAAKALLTSLLRDASRPYMTMLNEWLHLGTIRDPHTEFLVREQKSIRRERLEEDYTDEYWDRRYTIRDHGIPPQLEAMKEKVLLAGKYLNVVRECGGSDVYTIRDDIPRSFDDPRFAYNVNVAYAHANASLLRLLLTTYALPARMQSLKHYFFLDRSDFFSDFLELGKSELRKPVDKVNIVKLQSLLDLVLRQPGSVAAFDSHKEDVRVEMNRVSLKDSLTRVLEISSKDLGDQLQYPTTEPSDIEKSAVGFSSLQFNYLLPFPLSLVISRKTIWRYQVLFRHLVSLRHLEHQLTDCWQIQNRAPTWSHSTSDRKLESWKRRTFTLRARMLVFVQQLLYFCTSEVIEPNWQLLMEKLTAKGQGSTDSSESSIGTVDELMKEHINFLDTCLKECMLTNSKLLKINSKLMHTCALFTTFTTWFSHVLEKNDPDLTGAERPATMNKQQWVRFQNDKIEHESSAPSASTGGTDEAQLERMEDLLKKCEFSFGRHLQILIDALNHYAATETVILLGLCAKLSMATQGANPDGLEIAEEVIG